MCQLFVTPWTVACQASLYITNTWSLLRLMTITSVMPPNHLILCCPLLLLPSIFPSIRVFSNQSVLHIRWPKYWSFSFSISPPKEEWSEVAQLYPTLFHPMDCSPPSSSVHWIFQARILQWVAISLPQEIFLTQGSNLDLPHCMQTVYHLNH